MDKFQKIVHLFQKTSSISLENGNFFVDNKIIEFSAEETFQKNFMLDKQKILYIIQKA